MKKYLLLIGLLFLTGCSTNVKSGIVTCDQKDSLVKESNTILVDVREKSEYDQGHLDGAINIPYTEIGIKIEQYTKDKDTKIIVYCLSGKRSQMAYDILENKGFKNIYNLGSINNC